jgi:flavin reductase (DIM6/NTAB) family NADH-FMN oxidoreductase RutF
MIELDPQGMTRDEIYKVLTGAVAPRPIAWITTRSRRNVVNAAPFSAYTLVSQDPPLVLFQADAALREKDTIVNIRNTEEFVVNVATMRLLDAMHQCSAPLPPDVSETEAFGIELADSKVVAVPRVAASPVAFECRLYRMFDVGNEPHTIVIGEVVCFQIDESVFADGKIDQRKLDPVSRIGGPYYARMGEFIHKPVR